MNEASINISRCGVVEYRASENVTSECFKDAS